MTQVLALADEVHEPFYGPRLEQVGLDLVVACGDLPFEYLEYVVTMTNVPLLYVPGNHDPDLARRAREADMPFLLGPHAFVTTGDPPGPTGCTNVDGRIVDAAGLRVAGLGGCIRYTNGPNQYTQKEMRRRALSLEMRGVRRRMRDGRGVDLLVTHAPPRGVGDGDDAAHHGFEAFHRLVTRWRPRMLIHGHVHPYGRSSEDRRVGQTQVINAISHRCLEVEP
jgi:hypothetical protein